MKLERILLATPALALLFSAPAAAQLPFPNLFARLAGLQLAADAAGPGSGTWVIPTDVVGQVDGILEDETGTAVFLLDAELTRFIPAGGTTDESGGIYGNLLAADRNGNLVVAATIEGQWIQHTDGTGSVAALVKARTGNAKQPMVVVGSLDGTFAAPTLSARDPRLPGKVYLRWRLFA